jgi:hypothetical protein
MLLIKSNDYQSIQNNTDALISESNKTSMAAQRESNRSLSNGFAALSLSLFPAPPGGPVAQWHDERGHDHDECDHTCNHTCNPLAAQGPAPMQSVAESKQAPFQCTVRNCRHAHAHDTIDHQCGNCGAFGHGRMECLSAKMPAVAQFRCRVHGCRHPDSHVTSGHKCGTCNKFGHGAKECGNGNECQRLRVMSANDIVLTPCTVEGCKHQSNHTVHGHVCTQCNRQGHGAAACRSRG